jgi:hypothetical protein
MKNIFLPGLLRGSMKNNGSPNGFLQKHDPQMVILLLYHVAERYCLCHLAGTEILHNVFTSSSLMALHFTGSLSML